MRHHRIDRSRLVFFALIPAALFGITAVFYGRLTGDEGWYVLAATDVMQGKLPYRDFLFTQMPLLPYFYGTLMTILGKGMFAGRLISFTISMASVAMLLQICRREGGINAAGVAALLLGMNLSYVFHTCAVKTQSLTVFLVTASLFALRPRQLSRTRDMLSLFLMTLAFLTRLSVIPCLLALIIYLFQRYRPRLACFAKICAAPALCAGLVIAFFYANGNMIFGVITFHSEYYSNPALSMSSMHTFLNRFFLDQYPIIIAFIVSCVLFALRLVRNNGSTFLSGGSDAYAWMLIVSYAAATAIHVTRPISYACYQISIIPFVILFASLALGDYLDHTSGATRRAVYTAIFFSCLAGMPLQEYDVSLKGDGTLRKTIEASRAIRELSAEGDRILTFATELAVESRLVSLPGYELSEFAYFPVMRDEVAAKLHVVDQKQLYEDLREKNARILCLTPRDFAIMAGNDIERLARIIRLNYVVRRGNPLYGQFRQTLTIYTAR